MILLLFSALSRYEALPGVSLADHENLEQWKREAIEKFYRLKALRSRNDELTRTFGYSSACPKHAEIVLCVPSKQELAKETSRKQVAALHKTMYFPEICTMEGPNQIVARNCTKVHSLLSHLFFFFFIIVIFLCGRL